MTFRKILTSLQYGKTLRLRDENSAIRFVDAAGPRADMDQEGHLAFVVLTSGKQMTVLSSDIYEEGAR